MIIKSLLDLDLYKLTMMQLAWKNYHNLIVEFEFKNRTDVDIFQYIDVVDLVNEVENISNLKFTEEEIEYLSTIKSPNYGYDIFEQDFLKYLKEFRMGNCIIGDTDGKVTTLTARGKWCDVILWETIVLSIVNEMYYKGKYTEEEVGIHYLRFGFPNLESKLNTLKEKKFPKIITDFGTRRRFSHKWHENVITQIKDHPSFMGTSNVYMAKKYGMVPVGTNAHELYMISAGYYDTSDENLKGSHGKIMDEWYDMYGYDLSIGLTDTFGTDFFFEDFKSSVMNRNWNHDPTTRAELWKGVRHDSGDPFEFGERVIEYYKELGIDPKEKLIVFSDGLDMEKILKLQNQFEGRINLSYGWGTKLTNDIGFETLSIVMKAVRVISETHTFKNGENVEKHFDRSLVKLSDNLNKHTGNKKDIERYKRVFNYTNTEKEKLIV